MITIGIDPHKSSLTAVAVQPSGEVSATIRLEVNRDTVALLRAWAQQWPPRQWAVEGAAGLGRGVTQGLSAADEPVVDVPAQLAARARLLNTGHARKSDPIDAAAVAMVAQHHRRLHPVHAEDDSLVLRLLSERRDDLAAERTRTANRLHALLRDLIAGGAKRNLTADQAAALLRGVQPMTAVDTQCKQLSRELVADLRRLDAALARSSDDIAAAVSASGTSITQVHGIGRMTTASPDPDPDLGVARCNRSSVQLLGSWLTLQANGIDALRAVDAHKLVAELGYPTRSMRFLNGKGDRARAARAAASPRLARRLAALVSSWRQVWNPKQVDRELRRAQAEFHQLITSASPEDLRRPTDGTRWTNRQLLFHMVLGYGVVRTLLPLVRALGRLGHSRGFAATLNAGRRPFHWINYVGPCVAARLLTPRAIAALLDHTIGSLRRRLAAETARDLALSMHMPTGWDPYFTPTMSVLDVYHFGTQHFDHHRRQLTLPEAQAEP